LRLLVLGLSNLVRRRVLPALQEIERLDAVDIASRRGTADWQRPEWLAGDTYHDYDEALRRSGADVVYVSLVNSEHGRWARAALERGCHVVVDKPAFLGFEEADRALNLAAKRNVCLAEATVWAYHPQIDLMQRTFAEAGTPPTRVAVTFSVPPLDPSNFRYCRSLGGGSLWDLGPYAVSVGRVFFDRSLDTIDCHVLSFGGEENVETAFSVLATYPEGRSVVGHFGFDTAYRNHVEILSIDLSLEADRVFTLPAELENDIRVTRNTETTLLQAPAGNAFRPFFDRVFSSVEGNDWGHFTNDLLTDARGLQLLRDAAGVA
jgi:dTDP-3,4-didehydro-2,6-dideoxy-alpha-D-glucose 3-reductase